MTRRDHQPTRTRRPRWASVPAALAVSATAAMLGACGTPRAGGVSDVAPCAQVLPLTSTVVHGRGHIIAARTLKGHELRTLLGISLKHIGNGTPLTPSTASPSGAPLPPPHKVCVIVYEGDYHAGQVRGAPRTDGRYAILITRVHHPILLRALVLPTLPPILRNTR